MAVDIDFEGTAQPEVEQPAVQQTDDTTPLDGKNDVDDVTSQDGNDDKNKPDGNDDNSSTGELSEGDFLEFDGATYTVDKDGNLVDENGSIFKEAKDVADWMKTLDVDNSDSDSGFNIQAIQDALGVSITDAEGNDVEFTNDAAGVKSYVDAVVDLKSKEWQEGAINSLFESNPLLKQFNDYVQLTGSPRGFGEIPDRSGITVEKDNEAQQVAIIKMAAQEFNNKSLTDSYINYLKDSGALYDEAKNQLAALVEKDKQLHKDIEEKAEAQRKQEAQDIADYWSRVDKVVKSRVIAGYKLPESFVKEVDGKKVTLSTNDFYNYLSRPVKDESGRTITGYQRDLNNLTDKDYLNKELLDAWLMFTGGTYKDLVDMAVKEEQVRKLRLKSKEQRTNKTVKVIKKQSGKVDMNDIVL